MKIAEALTVLGMLDASREVTLQTNADGSIAFTVAAKKTPKVATETTADTAPESGEGERRGRGRPPKAKPVTPPAANAA